MQLKKDQIRYLLDQLIKQSSTLNNELWKEEIKQAANNQKIMVEDIYQDLINCNNQESWIGLLILMVSTIEVQIERLIIIGIKWKKFLSEIEENNIREDSEEWTEKYFNTIFEKDKKWQDRKFGREIFNFNWMKKLKKKYYEIYGKKLKEEDEFSKKYKYVRNALVHSPHGIEIDYDKREIKFYYYNEKVNKEEWKKIKIIDFKNNINNFLDCISDVEIRMDN
ncbi:hypothetical protein OF364_00015 [Mycoplasma enhydrae]|uniref:hypothetical protein n=1 Tax=Mycoplasma enhydrae TaxID=2499220 RepID=UPI0021E9279B|nr:hypothetical protein [Mycoplasma enhydrae]MCV3753213.1 hypothetical protein [Mycoplasma enhydrae]